MVQALWLSMTCVFVWDVAYLVRLKQQQESVEDATSDIWSTRSWHVDLSSIQLVLGHHWSKFSEADDRDDLRRINCRWDWPWWDWPSIRFNRYGESRLIPSIGFGESWTSSWLMFDESQVISLIGRCTIYPDICCFRFTNGMVAGSGACRCAWVSRLINTVPAPASPGTCGVEGLCRPSRC